MAYPIRSDAPTYMVEETENADIALAIEEIRSNYDFYEAAKEYDDINILEVLTQSRAGRTLRQADIEFDPNFCSVVIDSVLNKMIIQGIVATDKSNEPNEKITEELNKVLLFNELEFYLPEWIRKTLRDGDAYLCVWPDEDYDAVKNPFAINITCVDAEMGRMFYDSENPRKKRFFAQLWEVRHPGPRMRLNLYYPNRTEKYISVERGGKKAKDFIPYEDDDDGDEWPVSNPWGEIPVFHLRTRFPFGKPEHTNAFALQDALSKLVEMLMVAVDFQGYPQRYALQEADSYGTQHIQEDPLADSSPATEDSDSFPGVTLAKLPKDDWVSTETGSDYEASPGSLQLFKNFKEVGQFTTADPQAFLEPYREFIKSISVTTDTPLHKFQSLGGNTPSGESLRIANAPLNAKVRNRNKTIGAGVQQALDFAMMLAGIDAKVSITWQNPYFEDDLATWQLVEKKLKLGAPLELALIQAGVPEDQAKEWKLPKTSIEDQPESSEE